MTFEGHVHRHQVHRHMFVSQLAEESAAIFHLHEHDLVLMLFGLVPHTLSREKRISEPPPVGPGATVLILNIHRHARMPGGNLPIPGGYLNRAEDGNAQQFSGGAPGSKILGNFKLPKFDGTARYWKNWDKTFIRFLSIHQLDYVIGETFLAVLPLSPRDFSANKMVYYILEDALTPGSLAAKYFRQAAKGNGNEAYVKLYDGYAFSEPQTMTGLLAELVNIRFKADESASGFCLRLREVFEDLEMVPGHSSVTMNDTQKIGYLLTGIRQKKRTYKLSMWLCRTSKSKGRSPLRRPVRTCITVVARSVPMNYWIRLYEDSKKHWFRPRGRSKIKALRRIFLRYR